MVLEDMLTVLHGDGLDETTDLTYALLDKLQIAVERAREHGIVLRVDVGFALPRQCVRPQKSRLRKVA